MSTKTLPKNSARSSREPGFPVLPRSAQDSRRRPDRFGSSMTSSGHRDGQRETWPSRSGFVSRARLLKLAGERLRFATSIEDAAIAAPARGHSSILQQTAPLGLQRRSRSVCRCQTSQRDRAFAPAGRARSPETTAELKVSLSSAAALEHASSVDTRSSLQAAAASCSRIRPGDRRGHRPRVAFHFSSFSTATFCRA